MRDTAKYPEGNIPIDTSDVAIQKKLQELKNKIYMPFTSSKKPINAQSGYDNLQYNHVTTGADLLPLTNAKQSKIYKHFAKWSGDMNIRSSEPGVWDAYSPLYRSNTAKKGGFYMAEALRHQVDDIKRNEVIRGILFAQNPENKAPVSALSYTTSHLPNNPNKKIMEVLNFGGIRQGFGINKNIFAHVADQALNNDVSSIRLGSTEEGSPFYEHWGMKQRGDPRHMLYEGDPDHILRTMNVKNLPKLHLALGGDPFHTPKAVVPKFSQIREDAAKRFQLKRNQVQAGQRLAALKQQVQTEQAKPKIVFSPSPKLSLKEQRSLLQKKLPAKAIPKTNDFKNYQNVKSDIMSLGKMSKQRSVNMDYGTDNPALPIGDIKNILNNYTEQEYMPDEVMEKIWSITDGNNIKRMVPYYKDIPTEFVNDYLDNVHTRNLNSVKDDLLDLGKMSHAKNRGVESDIMGLAGASKKLSQVRGSKVWNDIRSMANPERERLHHAGFDNPSNIGIEQMKDAISGYSENQWFSDEAMAKIEGLLDSDKVRRLVPFYRDIPTSFLKNGFTPEFSEGGDIALVRRQARDTITGRHNKVNEILWPETHSAYAEKDKVYMRYGLSSDAFKKTLMSITNSSSGSAAKMVMRKIGYNPDLSKKKKISTEDRRTVRNSANSKHTSGFMRDMDVQALFPKYGEQRVKDLGYYLRNNAITDQPDLINKAFTETPIHNPKKGNRFIGRQTSDPLFDKLASQFNVVPSSLASTLKYIENKRQMMNVAEEHVNTTKLNRIKGRTNFANPLFKSMFDSGRKSYPRIPRTKVTSDNFDISKMMNVIPQRSVSPLTPIASNTPDLSKFTEIGQDMILKDALSGIQAPPTGFLDEVSNLANSNTPQVTGTPEVTVKQKQEIAKQSFFQKHKDLLIDAATGIGGTAGLAGIAGTVLSKVITGGFLPHFAQGGIIDAEEMLPQGTINIRDSKFFDKIYKSQVKDLMGAKGKNLTFWRGAREHDKSLLKDGRDETSGRWFTPDKNYAETYAKYNKGSMFRVDVPKSSISHKELQQWLSDAASPNEVVLPKKFAGMAQHWGKFATGGYTGLQGLGLVKSPEASEKLLSSNALNDSILKHLSTKELYEKYQFYAPRLPESTLNWKMQQLGASPEQLDELASMRSKTVARSFTHHPKGFQYFAKGGMIQGKGTSISDSINATLPPGYVIPQKTVKAMGKSYFDKLEGGAQTFQGLAQGGQGGQGGQPAKISQGEYFLDSKAVAKAGGVDTLNALLSKTRDGILSKSETKKVFKAAGGIINAKNGYPNIGKTRTGRDSPIGDEVDFADFLNVPTVRLPSGAREVTGDEAKHVKALVSAIKRQNHGRADITKASGVGYVPFLKELEKLSPSNNKFRGEDFYKKARSTYDEYQAKITNSRENYQKSLAVPGKAFPQLPTKPTTPKSNGALDVSPRIHARVGAQQEYDTRLQNAYSNSVAGKQFPQIPTHPIIPKELEQAVVPPHLQGQVQTQNRKDALAQHAEWQKQLELTKKLDSELAKRISKESKLKAPIGTTSKLSTEELRNIIGRSNLGNIGINQNDASDIIKRQKQNVTDLWTLFNNEINKAKNSAEEFGLALNKAPWDVLEKSAKPTHDILDRDYAYTQKRDKKFAYDKEHHTVRNREKKEAEQKLVNDWFNKDISPNFDLKEQKRIMNRLRMVQSDGTNKNDPEGNTGNIKYNIKPFEQGEAQYDRISDRRLRAHRIVNTAAEKLSNVVDKGYYGHKEEQISTITGTSHKLVLGGKNLTEADAFKAAAHKTYYEQIDDKMKQMAEDLFGAKLGKERARGMVDVKKNIYTSKEDGKTSAHISTTIKASDKDLKSLGLTADDVSNILNRRMSKALGQAEIHLDRFDHTVKSTSKGITALHKVSGIFGNLSWKMASLSMSAMGVYFSLQGVFMTIRQGVESVLTPLRNLDTVFQNIGKANAFSHGMNRADQIMKKLGITTQDLVHGFENVSLLDASMGTMWASLSAKIFKNDKFVDMLIDTFEDLFKTLSNKENLNAFVELITQMVKAIPDAVDALKMVTGAIKIFTDSNIKFLGKSIFTWIAFAAAASLIAQPVLSGAAAVLTMAAAASVALPAIGALITSVSGMIVPILLVAAAWEVLGRAITAVTKIDVPTPTKIIGGIAQSTMGAVGFKDGMIEGKGTSTSDSIPAIGPKNEPIKVSKGESILTGRATDNLGSDKVAYANKHPDDVKLVKKDDDKKKKGFSTGYSNSTPVAPTESKVILQSIDTGAQYTKVTSQKVTKLTDYFDETTTRIKNAQNGVAPIYVKGNLGGGSGTGGSGNGKGSDANDNKSDVYFAGNFNLRNYLALPKLSKWGETTKKVNGLLDKIFERISKSVETHTPKIYNAAAKIKAGVGKVTDTVSKVPEKVSASVQSKMPKLVAAGAKVKAGASRVKSGAASASKFAKSAGAFIGDTAFGSTPEEYELITGRKYTGNNPIINPFRATPSKKPGRTPKPTTSRAGIRSKTTGRSTPRSTPTTKSTARPTNNVNLPKTGVTLRSTLLNPLNLALGAVDPLSQLAKGDLSGAKASALNSGIGLTAMAGLYKGLGAVAARGGIGSAAATGGLSFLSKANIPLLLASAGTAAYESFTGVGDLLTGKETGESLLNKKTGTPLDFLGNVGYKAVGLSNIAGKNFGDWIGLDGSGWAYDAGQGVRKTLGYKSGGKISKGKGTSKSDSIPAMLSKGEYVINADAAKKLGEKNLDTLNKIKSPIHRAAGGAVGAIPETASAITSGSSRVLSNFRADSVEQQKKVQSVEKDIRGINKDDVKYNSMAAKTLKQAEGPSYIRVWDLAPHDTIVNNPKQDSPIAAITSGVAKLMTKTSPVNTIFPKIDLKPLEDWLKKIKIQLEDAAMKIKVTLEEKVKAKVAELLTELKKLKDVKLKATLEESVVEKIKVIEKELEKLKDVKLNIELTEDAIEQVKAIETELGKLKDKVIKITAIEEVDDIVAEVESQVDKLKDKIINIHANEDVNVQGVLNKIDQLKDKVINITSNDDVNVNSIRDKLNQLGDKVINISSNDLVNVNSILDKLNQLTDKVINVSLNNQVDVNPILNQINQLTDKAITVSLNNQVNVGNVISQINTIPQQVTTQVSVSVLPQPLSIAIKQIEAYLNTIKEAKVKINTEEAKVNVKSLLDESNKLFDKVYELNNENINIKVYSDKVKEATDLLKTAEDLIQNKYVLTIDAKTESVNDVTTKITDLLRDIELISQQQIKLNARSAETELEKLSEAARELEAPISLTVEDNVNDVLDSIKKIPTSETIDIKAVGDIGIFDEIDTKANNLRKILTELEKQMDLGKFDADTSALQDALDIMGKAETAIKVLNDSIGSIGKLRPTIDTSGIEQYNELVKDIPELWNKINLKPISTEISIDTSKIPEKEKTIDLNAVVSKIVAGPGDLGDNILKTMNLDGLKSSLDTIKKSFTPNLFSVFLTVGDLVTAINNGSTNVSKSLGESVRKVAGITAGFVVLDKVLDGTVTLGKTLEAAAAKGLVFGKLDQAAVAVGVNAGKLAGVAQTGLGLLSKAFMVALPASMYTQMALVGEEAKTAVNAQDLKDKVKKATGTGWSKIVSTFDFGVTAAFAEYATNNVSDEGFSNFKNIINTVKALVPGQVGEVLASLTAGFLLFGKGIDELVLTLCGELKKGFGAIGDFVSGFVGEGLAAGLQKYVGPAAKAVSDFASSAFSGATSVISGVYKVISTGASNTVGEVKSYFSTVGSIIGAGFNLASTGASTVYKALVTGASNTKDEIGAYFSTIGSVIGAGFNTASSIAGTVFNTMVSLGKTSVTGIIAAFSNVGTLIGSAFNTAGSAVGTALNTIGSVASTAAKTAVDAFIGIGATIGGCFSGIKEAVGNAVNGLFGSGGLLDPQSIIKGFSGIGNSIGGAFTGIKEAVGGAINGVFGSGGLLDPQSIITGFSGIGSLIGSSFGGLSDSVKGIADQVFGEGGILNANNIIAGFSGIGDTIGGSFSGLASTILQSFTGIFGQGGILDFNTLVTTASTFIATATEQFTGLASSITQAFTGVFGEGGIFNFNTLITAVQTMIATVTGLFTSFAQTAIALGTSIVTNLGSGISAGIAVVTGVITTLITVITTTIQTLIAGATALGASIIANLSAGISSATGTITGAISTTIGVITTTVQGIVSTISAQGTSIITNLSSGISSAQSVLQTTFQNTINIITTAWDGLVTGAKNWGGKLLEQVGNGLKEAKSVIQSPLESVLEWIMGFFPRSPAERGPLKDLQKSGAEVVNQLGQGMESNKTAANDAGNNVAGAVTDGINDGATQKMPGTADKIISLLGSAITDTSPLKMKTAAATIMTIFGTAAGEEATKVGTENATTYVDSFNKTFSATNKMDSAASSMLDNLRTIINQKGPQYATEGANKYLDTVKTTFENDTDTTHALNTLMNDGWLKEVEKTDPKFAEAVKAIVKGMAATYAASNEFKAATGDQMKSAINVITSNEGNFDAATVAIAESMAAQLASSNVISPKMQEQMQLLVSIIEKTNPEAAQKMKDLMSASGKSIEGTKDVQNAMDNTMKDTTKTVSNSEGELKGVMKDLISAMSDSVTASEGQVKTAVDKLMQTFADCIKNADQPAKTAMEKVILDAGNQIVSSSSNWKEATATAMDAMISSLNSSGNKLGSSMKSALSGAKSALNAFASEARSAGRKIADQVAAGISSGKGAITSAMKNALSGASSQIPHSPVREGPLVGLPKSGYEIINQLSQGVETGNSVLSSAISDVLKNAVSNQITEKISNTINNVPTRDQVSASISKSNDASAIKSNYGSTNLDDIYSGKVQVINSDSTSGGKSIEQNIDIHITVQGNADKTTTDDIVRKVAKELGIYAKRY